VRRGARQAALPVPRRALDGAKDREGESADRGGSAAKMGAGGSAQVTCLTRCHVLAMDSSTAGARKSRPGQTHELVVLPAALRPEGYTSEPACGTGQESDSFRRVGLLWS
jgi:hypothetical protein